MTKMPPKGKKGGGNAKDKKSGEEERHEPLQAVVLCDSFETRFNPFTLERPRCLLPLANTPLIEYTLEFLAGSGAEEIFLYCGNHTDTVEEYLQNSKWTSHTAPFSLEIIRSTSRSVGDCMRDLDQKGLIVGDFICVYGDVVANISLTGALAAHRARREKNKNAIMTMVLREAGESHRAKPTHMRPTFVIDQDTGRCAHYEQIRPGQSPTLDVPGEVLKDHVDLEVREDLIDCGIDICTPNVLAQYTDNFDWQLPRRGFLYGTLKDFETYQMMIHTHIVTEEYAARVKNLQAYDAISRDVVSRWTYPLTPDTNLVAGQTFQLHKGGVYREEGVVLARSSMVGRNCVLGKATSIGEQANITNSVIGRRCVIGNRVKIDGAYIWDDARIGDDTVIEKAVIANEASIGKRCKVERGALISYGTRVSDGTTVSGDRRVTTLKRKRGYETSDIVQVPADPKIVGEDGVGYHMEFDDEEEEEVAEAVLIGIQNMDLSMDDISTFDSDEEEDDEYEPSRARANSTRSDSFASIDSEESGENKSSVQEFHREAVNSLFDDMKKGTDPDTMQLELKSMRLTANAEDKQVRRALAVAFNKRVAHLMESGKSAKDSTETLFPQYNRLVKGCVSADEEDEQAEFLLLIQTDLTHRAQGEKMMLFLSNALATNDLIEAEGFEKWWNDERSSATEKLVAVRKETEQLVKVLCEEDEDEDDSEEEDSEDE